MAEQTREFVGAPKNFAPSPSAAMSVRDMPFSFPSDGGALVPAIYRLASRMGICHIDFYHQNGWAFYPKDGMHYLYSIYARTRDKNIVSRFFEHVGPNVKGNLVGGLKQDWESNAKAMFVSHSVDNGAELAHFADPPKQGSFSLSFPYMKWFAKYRPLDKPPRLGSPEETEARDWRQRIEREMKIWADYAGTPRWEQITLENALRSEIKTTIEKARAEFKNKIANELNGDLHELAQRMTLEKVIIQSIVSLAYPESLDQSDELHTACFGKDSLFDEDEVRSYLNDDKTGLGLAVLEDAIKKRFLTFQQRIAVLPSNCEPIVFVEETLKKLRSIKEIQKLQDR